MGGHARLALRLGRTTARLAATLVALAGAVFLLVPAVLGYERYVITSGSMTPAYSRGTLVLARPVPVRDLGVGDVITFAPPGRTSLVTHRIATVSVDPSGRKVLMTKGDANPVADPWRIAMPRGSAPRARIGVPYAGYGVALLADRAVRLGLIGVPALLIGAGALIAFVRDERRLRAEAAA